MQNCKRISHAAQLLLHLANNTTARTQIHYYLCQECGGYRQGYGRIEAHSFLLKRRESTLAARSKVLEMLEVEDGRWFGRLDDSPKVKWMRRVYPRVDYTQAPWTIVMLSGSRAEASTLQGRHRRFTGGSAFHICMSFRGLISLLATQQKWYHHLQQVVQSLIPHNNYRQYWCTQQTACSTHTHPYCN